MIEPFSSATPPPRSQLRNLSPLPKTADRFVASSQDALGLYSPAPELHQSAASPDGPSMLGRALLTACLAVGAVSGVMASFPAVAHAQVQVAPLRRSNNPAVRQLVASSLVTGRIPAGTVAERMARLKPEVRTHVQSLPPEVQQSYVDLDAGGRRWLSGQIAGSTDTYLGKVKHRSAFISGKVVIVNIFGVIKGEIKSEVKKGTIPREAQPRINAYLDKLKRLQPAQRETLVKALETEFPKTP